MEAGNTNEEVKRPVFSFSKFSTGEFYATDIIATACRAQSKRRMCVLEPIEAEYLQIGRTRIIASESQHETSTVPAQRIAEIFARRNDRIKIRRALRKELRGEKGNCHARYKRKAARTTASESATGRSRTSFALCDDEW
jgi:hypothetical protein